MPLPDSLPVFLARISALLRDGGAILAMFNTRPPERPYRYRVVDEQNLELLPSPQVVPPQHIYQNREIQLLFERFRWSKKSFVGRDQFRERSLRQVGGVTALSRLGLPQLADDIALVNDDARLVHHSPQQQGHCQHA